MMYASGTDYSLFDEVMNGDDGTIQERGWEVMRNSLRFEASGPGVEPYEVDLDVYANLPGWMVQVGAWDYQMYHGARQVLGVNYVSTIAVGKNKYIDGLMTATEVDIVPAHPGANNRPLGSRSAAAYDDVDVRPNGILGPIQFLRYTEEFYGYDKDREPLVLISLERSEAEKDERFAVMCEDPMLMKRSRFLDLIQGLSDMSDSMRVDMNGNVIGH